MQLVCGTINNIYLCKYKYAMPVKQRVLQENHPKWSWEPALSSTSAPYIIHQHIHMLYYTDSKFYLSIYLLPKQALGCFQHTVSHNLSYK